MGRITLDDTLARRLDEAAKRADITADSLASEAVRAYLDLDDWRAVETRKGLSEADAGEFATDAEVEAVRTKWRG